MKSILIQNALLINEGKIFPADVFVKNGIIEKIERKIDHIAADTVINAEGKYLMPGVIDDQVHFREPGLTHKAEIYTEALAAVAGGTTSYMEMPNTNPQTLTQELLEEKYRIAANRSLANYSFYMGVSNDNADEVLRTDPVNVCGLKIFMGSSTGNMLVDNEAVLERIFSSTPMLIATHCEDEPTVRQRSELFREMYGDAVLPEHHPVIRDEAACLRSSHMAVGLAKKHGTRLHILHISTSDELSLFDNKTPLRQKKITSEACVHHLSFHAGDYAKYGFLIKCNPAIKDERHQKEIWQAVLDDRIDVIATDHAPHTWDEKGQNYWKSPSGVPLVQHSLHMMLEAHQAGKISLTKIVEKMCHAVAECFRIEKRGYIREGYFADLVLFDLHDETTVSKENILYKCKWSPYEGHTFRSKICSVIVSGHLAYHEGKFDESRKGMRLKFEA
jgi:dihydroorotase